MGSYDTGEYSYTPRRSISEGRRSTYTPPSRTTSSSSTRQSQPNRTTPAYNKPAPESQYDASLPSVIALGGGLTQARIVKQVPDNLKEGSLQDIIDHLVKSEVVTTKEETGIAEDVRQRRGNSDYRAVINNFHTLHNSKLGGETATKFYQKITKPTAQGTKSMNFIDIAIVSHDEGGVAHMYNLEQKI